MTIATPRITLERITPALARRIVDRHERPGDAWHPENPFADQLDPLRDLATQPGTDPDFTMYLLRRNADGLAVGGFGFFGPPDASGLVEFGYGLIDAARGDGLATEAVHAGLDFAAARGAQAAAAGAEVTNVASQRVLEKLGLRETHREGTLVHYRRELTG